MLFVITLHLYTQQGYAFGNVYVCIMCMYNYVAAWSFTTWKSLVSVLYCSFVEFNHQKRNSLLYTRSATWSEKEIILWTERILENCFTVAMPTLSTCNAAANECRTPINMQLYNIATGTVLTVLSAHNVCILRNSSYYIDFWLHIRLVALQFYATN